MTTGSVSQAGAEVLYRVVPEAKVGQAGAEYLHTVIPGVRVSQSGAEYLHRVIPGFAVTQAGVELLYKSVPCGTRWAQIWTITRTDGVVYRFTSLDRDLEWPPTSGVRYDSCNGLDPSASEAVAEVNDAGSMDLSGALGIITEHALYAGLCDGATVEAWLVPWNGVGFVRCLLKGTFGEVSQSQATFKIEVLGDGARLQQTPLVGTLQPGCRWKFGSAQCGKDLGPLTVTGTVDSATSLRAFVDAARAETAGYFSRGEVTFTSGDNAGVTAQIKEHATGGHFTLWPRVPYPIAPGVSYEMTPGCTLLREAANGTNGCDDWGRFDPPDTEPGGYGGFLDVPTKDKLAKGADVKEPS